MTKTSTDQSTTSVAPTSVTSKPTTMTKERAYELLNTVIDPELHIGIVDLGLIYDVSVATVQTGDGPRTKLHILMTLTTPGCPLAGVFDQMVKQAFVGEGIDLDQDITVELTFDPPWLIEMMDPEARARIGL